MSTPMACLTCKVAYDLVGVLILFIIIKQLSQILIQKNDLYKFNINRCMI